ncbi:MAG: response regulator transcription factor [candidate division NC10 bacterium]|nr:response regulator transcription factor [candidate division NC10 bacterium]
MGKLRVLVADDHAVFRAGLRLLLEAGGDMEVVGEAGDGLEAVEKALTLQADLVLMDLAMPTLNGVEAIRRIKERQPRMPILALTMHEDDRYFFRALQAGASGYVVKGSRAEELLTAIRVVCRGEVYLYPSVARRLLEEYRDGGRVTGGRAETLTPREREILQLFAEGRTGKEVADRLCLSPHTVERHRANIMGKLGLHNRAELVRYAIRHGLIDVNQ